MSGFLLQVVNWSLKSRQECFIYSTVTINYWKKLFNFWDRGSIPRPHAWMPNALPIVLTCHSASYFSFVLFVNANVNILLYSFQTTFILSYYSFYVFQAYLRLKLRSFSVCFQTISHLSDYVLIEHVSLRNPPVSNSLNCFCLIEWVSASSC